MPERPSPLVACCRQFATAKRGHDPDEYEDAARTDPDAGRFAVADGASESSYSGLWANLLVDTFVASPPDPETADGWLDPIRARWHELVPSAELPWYAEVKRDEEGASATFLGLEFGREGRDWRAVAVGDSCLIQLRGGEFRRGFPVETAADFDNHPSLVCTRPGVSGRPEFRWYRSRLESGDRFLLMTDALALWCLQRREAGRPPWDDFDRLRDLSDQDFPAWVERLRSEGGLKNDDVTLVMVDVSSRDPG